MQFENLEHSDGNESVQAEVFEKGQELSHLHEDIKSLSEQISETRNTIAKLEQEEEVNKNEYITASRANHIALEQNKRNPSINKTQSTTNQSYMECSIDNYNNRPRSEYITSLNEEQSREEMIKEAVDNITNDILALQVHYTHDNSEDECYKRLVVTRLLSLLDDLQESIEGKVHEFASYDDTEADLLFHTLQELTLERERTLSVLRRKERAIVAAIALKKSRVNELNAEAETNIKLSREVNDREVIEVVKRIEDERHRLNNELERMETANAHFTKLIHQTKLSGSTLVMDKLATLPLDNALAPTSHPSKECVDLRARINVATSRQQELVRRINTIKDEIDKETNIYDNKIGVIEQKVVAYQGECARLEQENDNLCKRCDEIAELLHANEEITNVEGIVEEILSNTRIKNTHKTQQVLAVIRSI